jgi:hypothetical protein
MSLRIKPVMRNQQEIPLQDELQTLEILEKSTAID